MNSEETMPPTIGAAMRFITSAQAPVLHKIGNKPIKEARLVISMGGYVGWRRQQLIQKDLL